MRELANGRTHIDITHAEGRDEIAAMAMAVQIFKENIDFSADRLAADLDAESRGRDWRAKTLQALNLASLRPPPPR